MKFVLFSLCSIFFIIVSPILVEAHVLETSNTVGGVLHISPDDNPIVGEPTRFFVEIKDTSGLFDWETCGCQLSIWRDNGELYADNFSENGVEYVFDKKGVYEIRVAGKKPDFLLTYSVRVSREESGSPTSVSLWQRIVEWVSHLFLRR